eukprot:gene31145-40500_t
MEGNVAVFRFLRISVADKDESAQLSNKSIFSLHFTMSADSSVDNHSCSVIVKSQADVQSSSLDLVTDLFHGLYVLLWNPTQHILFSEASVIGHIISAPESEMSYMGSIMSVSSLRKVISGIFSLENILTILQIQQCLSLNSIRVYSHNHCLIPAPAVLEVGSDKIWALLVLSELFGLRAVSAQCSQRLARLCKAEGPIDSTGERRVTIPPGLRKSLLDDDVADIEEALSKHFAAYPVVPVNLTPSPSYPVETARSTYPEPPPPTSIKAAPFRDATAMSSRVRGSQDDIKIRDSYSPSPHYFHFQRYIHHHSSPPEGLPSADEYSMNGHYSIGKDRAASNHAVDDRRFQRDTTLEGPPVIQRDQVRYVLTYPPQSDDPRRVSVSPAVAQEAALAPPKGSITGPSKALERHSGGAPTSTPVKPIMKTSAMTTTMTKTTRSLSTPRTTVSGVFSFARTSSSSSSSSSSRSMYSPLSAISLSSTSAASAALAAEKDMIRTRLKSLRLKTAVIRIKNAHKGTDIPAPPTDRPLHRTPSPRSASPSARLLSSSSSSSPEEALAEEERKFRTRLSEEGYDGTYSSYRSRVNGRRVAAAASPIQFLDSQQMSSTRVQRTPSRPDDRSKSPQQQAFAMQPQHTALTSKHKDISKVGSSQKRAIPGALIVRPTTPSPTSTPSKGIGGSTRETSPRKISAENGKRATSPSSISHPTHPSSEPRHRSPPRETNSGGRGGGGGGRGSIRSSDKVAELRKKSSLISYRYRYASASASMAADDENASDIERGDIVYTKQSWAAVGRGMSPSKVLLSQGKSNLGDESESDHPLLTPPTDRNPRRATGGNSSSTPPTQPTPARATTSKGVSPSPAVVSIVVVRCWGLREIVGGSNPYVIIDWGPCGKLSTQAVMDSTEPYFGCVLKFPAQVQRPAAAAIMKVYVYSRNLSTSDELLGYVEISSDDLLARSSSSAAAECATLTYQLVDLLDKQNHHAGCIQLSRSL